MSKPQKCKQAITAYKLTRKNREAYGGFVWPVNEWVETSGKGNICSTGWTHWYSDPVLAVFMNPIYGFIPEDNMLLWEGEVEGKIKDDRGLKFGATRGRIIKQIPIPQITREERVCAAIMLAKEVSPAGNVPEWDKWANDYLSGENRDTAAADAAAKAVADAAAEATRAGNAEFYAAYAAKAVADAAVYATRAGDAEFYAAYAAKAVAGAVAEAAESKKLDIVGIINKAIDAERKRFK